MHKLTLSKVLNIIIILTWEVFLVPTSTSKWLTGIKHVAIKQRVY